MATYKEYNYPQRKFIRIFCDNQILAGTFEPPAYNNDETDAPAYDPAILLTTSGMPTRRPLKKEKYSAQH
jgi:hypothetical protein